MTEEERTLIFESALARVRERHFFEKTSPAPTWEQLLREAHVEYEADVARLLVQQAKVASDPV